MKPISAKRERGAALLALLAVIMLAASWYLVSQLNAESGGITAVNRARNAAILNRAKLALIGYVAQKAAAAGENNPGRLPCPEAVNNIGTTDEGGSAPWIGPPATSTCSSIGRLPWRTLGLEKLVDAAGEPLWYVVGPIWRLTNSSSTLLINSNTAGDITVDGQQVVALIIAPGAAMNAQAATGCTAKNQARSTPSPTMDYANYIECFTGTSQFVTTASSTSYNDQAIPITVADIMPAIESAIADRIEREILPALQTVYTPAAWGFTGTNPILPFAAPFASPGPGTGTSNYHGASGTYAGLLPFNQMRNCTVSAADPRCTSTVLTYSKASADIKTAGSGSIHTNSSCSWQATVFVCTGQYDTPSISVTVSIKVANVAGGLRTLSLPDSKVSFTAMNDIAGGWGTQTIPFTKTMALDSTGALIITIASGPLTNIGTAGWGSFANYQVSINDDVLSPIFGDHSLLSTTNGTTGWFARNEWYRLLYYAVAASNTAGKVATERSCTATPADCLTVTTNTTPASKSALLVLAGRSVNGRSRPSATPTDYFEFGNAKAAYERQTITPAAVTIYADTGAANAYTIAVTSLATGASLQFRATNANTGNSTLNTSATGTRSLVNLDGSNLAAATIQANAAVQVTWDGTKFLLAKRPFNDRVVAIGSN